MFQYSSNLKRRIVLNWYDALSECFHTSYILGGQTTPQWNDVICEVWQSLRSCLTENKGYNDNWKSGGLDQLYENSGLQSQKAQGLYLNRVRRWRYYMIFYTQTSQWHLWAFARSLTTDQNKMQFTSVGKNKLFLYSLQYQYLFHKAHLFHKLRGEEDN